MSTKTKTSAKRAGKDRKDRIRSFIVEHWSDFAETLDRYRWPLEDARWHELVFCIICRAGRPQVDATAARRIANALGAMNMLHPEALARSISKGGEPDFESADLLLMLRFLELQGLSPKQAKTTAGAVCKAAALLHERHGGKIQRYLRSCGERILNDMRAQFPLTGLDDEDSRHVFIHWLQNVLNMPLCLEEPAMTKLNREFDATIDDWVTVADELDVNLALLDDMIAASAGMGIDEDRVPRNE